MLKELIQLWKHRGIMIKAVDTFGSMIDECAYIFKKAWKVHKHELNTETEKADIRGHDKMVNQMERDIRKLLVEHLSLNPGQDASGCLALMSMVKDAERIGDYSKNIFDLATLVENRSLTLRHMGELDTVHAGIDSSLGSLKAAFIDSDEQTARLILERYKETKVICNRVLKAPFEEEMSKQEALTTVLLARYLKRVNSHVSNVASGIIFPLDKIDFVRGGLME